ncbi:MAG: hypothetical protein KY464_09100 [Gemmatimonadetes bacterium]|nr:hypothetical protein [Gemmatimonadota bacterium]
MTQPRIFLLSPAHCGGKRAAVLLRPEAPFELAERVRSPVGAPLGEVFSFVSGLYFRGKMAYATRFASPPGRLPDSLVITTCRGLLSPHTLVRPPDLEKFAGVPIDPRDPRYREPLEADLARLAAAAPAECRFVLLGSVATVKYVQLLLSALGDRLLFPAAFAGMGDMQRGALLLRSARAGVELPYLPVAGAVLSSRASPAGGVR